MRTHASNIIRHTFAIARKEIWHIIRDPISLFLVGFGPVIMLIIISYAFAVEVRDVPTLVLDLDRTEASRELIERLDATEVLDVIGTADDMSGVERAMDARMARVAVVIDRGLEAMFPAPSGDLLGMVAQLAALAQVGDRGLPVSYIVDGTEPISAETAIETAIKETNAFLVERARALLDMLPSSMQNLPEVQRAREQLETPIALEVITHYNPEEKTLWDLVPAMIAIVLTMPAMSVATVIAKERDQGTLEFLVATPAARLAILTGKMLPYVLIGVFNVLLMYLAAVGVFGLPFRGNLLLYVALMALYEFACLAIGLFFSIVIPNQEAALWVSLMFFLFPGFFLSGMFFPIVAMPLEMRMEAMSFPVSGGVFISRSLFLQGVGLDVVWWAVGILIYVGAIMLALSVLFFKKRIA